MQDPNLPTEQGALSEIRALPEALLGGSDAEVAHILRARCYPFQGIYWNRQGRLIRLRPVAEQNGKWLLRKEAASSALPTGSEPNCRPS